MTYYISAVCAMQCMCPWLTSDFCILKMQFNANVISCKCIFFLPIFCIHSVFKWAWIQIMINSWRFKFLLFKMPLDFLCIPLYHVQWIYNKITYLWVLHYDDDQTAYCDDNHHAFAVALYRCSHEGTLVAMLCLRWLVEVKAKGLIQVLFQRAFS